MATDIDVKSFTPHNDAKDLTFNQLLGINNEGVIAGYFGSGQVVNGTLHPNKGYTLNPPYGQGNFVNENFPGSVQTQVTGINNNDRTVGFWVDGVGNNFGFVDHDGRFTNVVDPNSRGQDGGLTFDQLLGVNDKNNAVGFWTDGNMNNHGFTYDVKTGSFSEVNIAGFASTTTTAINNKGDIAGFASNGGADTSFIKEGNKLEMADRAEGCRVCYGSRHQQRRSGCRIIYRRRQPDTRLPVRRAVAHLQDHRRSEPTQCRRRRDDAQRHQRQGPGCRLLYG